MNPYKPIINLHGLPSSPDAVLNVFNLEMRNGPGSVFL